MTPFSETSAIGRFSQGVVAELAKYADVVLWHPEGGEIRKTAVKKVRLSKTAAVEAPDLSTYDLVVYNLGNHLPFHREIVQLAKAFPGICIMHDFVMHHFFAGYYLEELKDPAAYLSAIHRLYGDRGRREAEASLAGNRRPLWETDEVVDYPFFEEAIRGSYGVIVHSQFCLKAIRRSYSGPARKIHLAYQPLTEAPRLSRADLAVPSHHCLIVTIGHVNPNKRVDAIIEALAGERDLAGRLTYAVLGPYDTGYHDRLQRLVKQHDLQDAVRFAGYVTDDVMQSYLMHAEICINLRYPATEGASASIIEEMHYGKAVVVTDTGFYSELPDDCVVKIHPDREAQELPAALRKLIRDDEFRTTLGSRAKQYAEKHFVAEAYAKEFLNFASEARKAKPLFQLADKVALELNHMGVHAGMQIAATVSSECGDLFGEDPAALDDQD